MKAAYISARRAWVLLAVAVVACIIPGRAAKAQTWNGSVDSTWNTAGNWTPAGVPNSSTANVTIGSPATLASPVHDNVTVTVLDLTLNAGSGLDIDNGFNFTISSGGTVTDNGLTILNSTAASSGTGIGINGTVDLTGMGDWQLNALPGNLATANIFDGGSSSLTQEANHTISGVGQIRVNAFTNNGTVNANSSGNTLLVESNSVGYTNTNLMEATNSGILQLQSTAFTNTGATIESNGGTVLLVAGSITGGTLTSTSGSEIDEQSSTTLGTLTLSTGSNLKVIDGNNLIFGSSSTITDNGTITLNKGGTNIGTGLGITGTVDLTGTGAIVLNAFPGNLATANIFDNGSSNLTQEANHTISGVGQIRVNVFTNNGTVNANSSGNTLLVESNSAGYTNTSLMEATNSGTLQLQSTAFTNTGGTIKANGGTVSLVAGSITGGTLTSISGSEFDEQGNATLGTITLSSGSNLKLLDGNDLFFASGSTITNNGTITVNKGGTNIGTGIGITGTVDLTGAGSIVLNAFPANLATANIFDGGSSNLTQEANHTISGIGQIRVNVFTNNGTVNANSSGNAILLATNSGGYTNTSLIESTNGGILELESTPFTNTGGIIEANGGSMLLVGGSITGGTLTSTSTSEIDERGNTTLGTITLSSGSTLKVLDGNDLFFASGSTITDNGTITVNKGGTNTGTGIGISGTVDLTGTGAIVLNAFPTNTATADIFDGGSSNLTQEANHTISGTGQIAVNVFTNNGTVNANSSGNTLAIPNANTNNGTYQASAGGTLNVSNLTNYSAGTLTGGSYKAIDTGTGATLNINGAAITTNAADVTLSGPLSVFSQISPLNNNSGAFRLEEGRGFTTVAALTDSGTVQIDGPDAVTLSPASKLTVTGNYTQSAGTTIANGLLTITGGTYALNGGTLKGSGTVTVASLLNSGGAVSPGNSPGLLTEIGGYTQSTGGALDIEIAGSTPGTQYDVLDVIGNADLGGTLNASLIDGFNPSANQSFTILNATDVVGTFSTTNIPANWTVTYLPTSVVLNAPVPEPATFFLLGLSVTALLLQRRGRTMAA